jgi:hypothetical protein
MDVRVVIRTVFLSVSFSMDCHVFVPSLSFVSIVSETFLVVGYKLLEIRVNIFTV